MTIHSVPRLLSFALAAPFLTAQFFPLQSPRQASLPLANVAAMLAHGDVDADGDLDLVVSNDFLPTVLFLNDGRGGFLPAPAGRLVSPSVIDNHAISLADIDGDGDLDVLMGNEDLLPNRVYVNDGTGAFTDVTATALPPNAFDTKNQVIADFDGDGDVDWLAIDLGGCHYYRNDGTGVFADASATHLVGVSNQLGYEYVTVPPAKDLDGDGDLDALVVGSAGLLRNQGGVLSPFPTQLPLPARDLDPKWLHDLDADGDVDVIAGRGARILQNQGNATFVDVTAIAFPSTPPIGYAAFDGDGDGDVDLLAPTALWRNDGTGRFTSATATPLVTAPLMGESVADFDGDGDLELPGTANFRVQLDAPLEPRLGLGFVLDVIVPTSTSPAFAELLVGSLGAPLPFPGLGLLRIDLTQPVTAIPLGVLNAPRRLVWVVPNDPNLVGLGIAFQAAVLVPSRAPFFGNTLFETIR